MELAMGGNSVGQDQAGPPPDVGEAARAYAFGPFRLVPEQGELLRDGEPVTLRPKSFDVLHYLVRHPQQLIRRDELLREVWPDVVVTDDSLTQCLIEVRKALDDRERRVVRTVPRRGYRFDLPVRVVRSGQARGVGQEDRPDPQSGTAPRLPSRWTLAALLVLAVAVGTTWWRAGSPPEPAEAPVPSYQPAPGSIAVLPFVDMSPEGDQEYLGDGIAEEILNLLAQVPGLMVIARTSSFSFKGENADIVTIARRLNVAQVLEGSVRKSGDRVRITAQLVNGADGAHLLSQTFEEPLREIFATQDAIATSVADVLHDHLLGAAGAPQTAPRRAVDPEAWDLYLRGQFFYGRRMPGDVLRAQQLFEQALAKQDLAQAWVSLAATYDLRGRDPHTPPGERIPYEEARPLKIAALQRAIDLEPDHPEALLRMARINFVSGAVELALDQVERAMANGRNHALAQSILAGMADSIGDPVVAAVLQGRAAALDPLSAVHQSSLGYFLYMAGRLEEAEVALQRYVGLNPQAESRRLPEFVWLAIHRRDFAAAARLAAQLPEGIHRDQAVALLGFQVGDADRSAAALARLQRSDDPAAPAALANVYAFRGEADDAFRSLEQALTVLASVENPWERMRQFTDWFTSPFLLPLQGDARWQDLVPRARRDFRVPEQERIAAMLQRYVAESEKT